MRLKKEYSVTITASASAVVARGHQQVEAMQDCQSNNVWRLGLEFVPADMPVLLVMAVLHRYSADFSSSLSLDRHAPPKDADGNSDGDPAAAVTLILLLLLLTLMLPRKEEGM
jgi:hypothetical protein